MVGKVIDSDAQPDGQAWGPALRMLIEIDIIKPLARGRTVNLHGL